MRLFKNFYFFFFGTEYLIIDATSKVENFRYGHIFLRRNLMYVFILFLFDHFYDIFCHFKVYLFL